MLALLTHAPKYLAVIVFGITVVSSTYSETARDENIFVLDSDDSDKFGRNPQQLTWEKYLGNYLLTNNIRGARIGANIVGLTSVAFLGVGFTVPIVASVVDDFNPENYDCSPANPDRLVVAFTALSKENKSSGSSGDKSSYLQKVTKFMTADQLARGNELLESCAAGDSGRCKLDIYDDLSSVSLKTKFNKVDSNWGLTHCKQSGLVKFKLLQNIEEESFVLQEIEENTIIREFSAKQSVALDVKFRTNGMVKEKIEYRSIPHDIQSQLRFNQKLKFEKNFSYKYDKNGNLEKKYGFSPIKPKLTNLSTNRFTSKAVQERTQSQNFYESYYKTGEIKEKKYFSKKGRPFLLKTFKKNGKVKKERRL
jgi:hypothetical protein